MKKVCLTITLFLILTCCTVGNKKLGNEAVHRGMTNLMTSYIRDIEKMDKEGVISHFYDNPDFHVYSDGQDFDVDGMKNLVRNEWYRGVKSIVFKNDSMKIHVFGPDVAQCFLKAIEDITDSTDNKTYVSVEVSFLGLNDNGKWRIAYAHAYHKKIEN